MIVLISSFNESAFEKLEKNHEIYIKYIRTT